MRSVRPTAYADRIIARPARRRGGGWPPITEGVTGMSRVVSIHSFRGGTGKSNVTANVATILASEGRRVGVVDTDIQSPGIHVLFGLDEGTLTHSLNDYL